MSDFWTSPLGEVTGSAADAFAKEITNGTVPDGTMALARIDSFLTAEYNGNKYLNIDWVLTDGEFKGHKVNHKLKVYGDAMAKATATASKEENSDKAKHRALNMLKLIYQLYNVKPTHAGEPTDKDLYVFVGKTAGIRIRETEPNDNGRRYNWVAEIHDAKGFKCETGVSVVVTHTNAQKHSQGSLESALQRNSHAQIAQELDDDIPF